MTPLTALWEKSVFELSDKYQFPVLPPPEFLNPRTYLLIKLLPLSVILDALAVAASIRAMGEPKELKLKRPYFLSHCSL